MTPGADSVDRAAAVRHALRSLVARHGFHGASMGAVAKEAGVATGTAYVHYASKDELVQAAFLEAKHEMGSAAAAHVDPTAPPRVRFEQLWYGVYEHLSADPDRARFLVQVQSSPYAGTGHEAASQAEDDPFTVIAVPDLLDQFVDLPPTVLYDLAIGPILRLAAGSTEVDETTLRTLAEGCWRAVTRPS